MSATLELNELLALASVDEFNVDAVAPEQRNVKWAILSVAQNS